MLKYDQQTDMETSSTATKRRILVVGFPIPTEQTSYYIRGATPPKKGTVGISPPLFHGFGSFYQFYGHFKIAWAKQILSVSVCESDTYSPFEATIPDFPLKLRQN